MGNTQTSESQKKSLSTGDAIAIIGLIFFILIWVGGWVAALVMGDSSNNSSDGSLAIIILVAIIAVPAMWAGDMIRKIIERD